jgi:hypothetical protein
VCFGGKNASPIKTSTNTFAYNLEHTHTRRIHTYETPKRRDLLPKRFNKKDEQQRYDSNTSSSGGRFVVVHEKLLFSLPRRWQRFSREKKEF